MAGRVELREWRELQRARRGKRRQKSAYDAGVGLKKRENGWAILIKNAGLPQSGPGNPLGRFSLAVACDGYQAPALPHCAHGSAILTGKNADKTALASLLQGS